jgi:hypothetical protein
VKPVRRPDGRKALGPKPDTINLLLACNSYRFRGKGSLCLAEGKWLSWLIREETVPPKEAQEN